MPIRSAGILLYRSTDKIPEVYLVHPGGPFWKNKDEGAWSIPKGEVGEGEDLLFAALREFFEETGNLISGDFTELEPVKLKSGKIVIAFARESKEELMPVKSNQFELEWPPKSGRMQSFPEIDKAEWFTLEQASKKINAGQLPLLKQVQKLI